jgi:branched-subunit amino acid aminotransferase/4-amino-4-deoxychorismate lyase
MSVLFIDGARVDEKDFSLLNHLGVGVFETFLVVRTESGQLKVRAFREHINRLINGISFLGLRVSISYEKVRDLIYFALSKIENAASLRYRARIVATDSHWCLYIEEMEVQEEKLSISLKSIVMERVFPEIKSCSAITSYVASKKAQRIGADQALLVDYQNIVREAAWANFFWIDQADRLKTAANMILYGITREIVLKEAVSICNVDISDTRLDEVLNNAKYAFITQSTKGITPVEFIDGNRLADCRESEIIRALNAKLTQSFEEL